MPGAINYKALLEELRSPQFSSLRPAQEETLRLYASDSALAIQAAEGRPVSNRSKASRGNCTNSACGAEFTK
jgi:hypothetical protein